MREDRKLFLLPFPSKAHSLVIFLPSLWITQCFIGYCNLFELQQGGFIIFVQVRMVLLGEFVEVVLNLLLLCTELDPQDGVQVLLLGADLPQDGAGGTDHSQMSQQADRLHLS